MVGWCCCGPGVGAGGGGRQSIQGMPNRNGNYYFGPQTLFSFLRSIQGKLVKSQFSPLNYGWLQPAVFHLSRDPFRGIVNLFLETYGYLDWSENSESTALWPSFPHPIFLDSLIYTKPLLCLILYRHPLPKQKLMWADLRRSPLICEADGHLLGLALLPCSLLFSSRMGKDVCFRRTTSNRCSVETCLFVGDLSEHSSTR